MTKVGAEPSEPTSTQVWIRHTTPSYELGEGDPKFQPGFQFLDNRGNRGTPSIDDVARRAMTLTGQTSGPRQSMTGSPLFRGLVPSSPQAGYLKSKAVNLHKRQQMGHILNAQTSGDWSKVDPKWTELNRKARLTPAQKRTRFNPFSRDASWNPVTTVKHWSDLLSERGPQSLNDTAYRAISNIPGISHVPGLGRYYPTPMAPGHADSRFSQKLKDMSGN